MDHTTLAFISPTDLIPITVLPPDRNPARVYLARLAPGSRRSMAHALNTIAGLVTAGLCDIDTMPWHFLRYQHTAAIRARLAQRYHPTSANLFLSALRGVLKECRRLNYMDADTYQLAVDISNLKKETLPSGRALTRGELVSVFQAARSQSHPLGVRDQALLSVLYVGGLRRSEVVGLDLVDYHAAGGELIIRRGKGNKERLVYISASAADALHHWLEHRGEDAGPLFCSIKKGGKITHQRLTTQAILFFCRKWADQARVKPFSPHDLRRTFISDLLEAGADISTVQKLAGHANVTTTTRYDLRGEAAKKKAVDLLNVPV